MSGGTSSPPNSAMSTYLDDWALAQDGPTRYDNMLGSPEATSSGSAASLQWPGGSPSDVFAQLQEELDIEHATITMEDQSPASCQAGAAERTEQVFISPECLSRLPSAVPFTPCALQVPNLVANSLQPSQPLDSTANVPAATPYFSPSTSSSTASPAPQPTETQDAAAHPQPRRGRGRAKLPEDKLKSVPLAPLARNRQLKPNTNIITTGRPKDARPSPSGAPTASRASSGRKISNGTSAHTISRWRCKRAI